MSFTEAEIEYLAGQNLGRLATVSSEGKPQNNPVSFTYNAELGTIDIGGHNLTASKKFRNLKDNPNVSFVVDALVSRQPWVVNGIEIRGVAEALTEAEPPHPWFGSARIRIHPRRILTWGIGDETGVQARNVRS